MSATVIRHTHTYRSKSKLTSQGVFTLGDVDRKNIDCDCKSEVNVSFAVHVFDADCKTDIVKIFFPS